MLDLIKQRRSIRKYTGEPVSAADIRTMLEAAMAAPSANNAQPWEFVVVQDPSGRRQLAETHNWSKMCAEAAVVFVICGHESSRHWVEDASAATENLLLTAAGLGLGAVWVAVYPNPGPEEHVRKLLGLPQDVRPLCLIPVGHPAERKPAGTKYDLGKVHSERY